jgi:predicted AlkP superfamily pyrophosphatase or phosphodiesterase
MDTMKVLLVVVDGMRPDAIADLPQFKRMRAKGTYCGHARTVMPSVTLPCHMSLFHSVDPQRHGVMTNIYTPQVRPVRGLFELLHQAGKTTAFFYNWEELRDIGRPGSLDHSLYVRNTGSDSDKYLADACRSHIKSAEPDFSFLYMGYTDEAGHSFGWMSPEYLKAASAAWDNIEQIATQLPPDYSLIVTADHGGHGRHHGTDIPEDMTIPLLCCGKVFAPGGTFENACILDIAPTAAKLLGLDADREWEGMSLI